jgi:ketosteroid isomerase-like protein
VAWTINGLKSCECIFTRCEAKHRQKIFPFRDRINGLARYGLGGRVDVHALLRAFCDAVERRDGAGFASLFSEDSVYHDAFYGAFVGRAKIAELIDDWFYRTAHDFRWDMHEPVTDGHTLYARYAFSYVSTLPEAQGRRVGFEGVSIMRLRDGLIAEYREVANVGPALVALGFAPERVCKILAREGKRLRDAPEMARHLV